MTTFDLKSFSSALNETNKVHSGVDFTGKSLKLDTEKDAKDIVAAITACPDLHYLTLTGNTLGVAAAQAIAEALEAHPELKVARWSDMFTGRMKTEIPPALKALGDGMIAAGARLKVLDLSDNAFGPIGVEGLAKLLQSDVCSELQELRLNNNGLGPGGARLLAQALSTRPPRLRVFVAGRNRLENAGATALAQVFEKMGSLEEVAMPQNGIYHPGIAALSQAFKQNPGLTCLNLNDNTIGPKGAAAVASALPRLRNLKAINFGDCLLKSAGARVLADAFRDNSTHIECLDLSHNEIGRAACRELVDALTALPDSSERLSRVVLAGNSLGNAASKQSMRAQLGAAGELSDDDDDDDGDDDDDDDDGDATESDSESDAESEEGASSEDSAPEDAQHGPHSGLHPAAHGPHSTHDSHTTLDDTQLTLDTSGASEVRDDVERFLREPSLAHLQRLGPECADVFEAHLASIADSSERLRLRVACALSVAGLSLAHADAAAHAQTLLARALRLAHAHAQSWPLTDHLLRGLALIKSEEKSPLRWHLPGCYAALAQAFPRPEFPPALRATLRFFIASKLPSLPAELREALQAHPVLMQQ